MSDPGPEPPAAGRAQPVVAILNHTRRPLGDVSASLARAGFQVFESESMTATNRWLGQTRPDLVLIDPLVLTPGGAELELVEKLQRDDDPVPVILVVEDLAALAVARDLRVPLRDFLVRPFSAAECLHRIDHLLTTRRRFLALHERTRQLEGQVSVDFKTGLISELYFQRVLALEWKRSQRHRNPLSLLLLDVDNFKNVNDSTEYAFGDEVLRSVGETIRETVRETDFAARCGGDEFCVLLPQTTAAEAVQTALRIRQRIANTTVTAKGYSMQISVSIGLDSFDGRSGTLLEGLRRNANKALQEAKRRGKNQVWLHSGPQDATAEA